MHLQQAIFDLIYHAPGIADYEVEEFAAECFFFLPRLRCGIALSSLENNWQITCEEDKNGRHRYYPTNGCQPPCHPF